MDVITIQIGDVVVLKLSGELRSREDVAAEFWSYLHKGVCKFVVNFENVRMINSVGLSAMLEFMRLAETSGGGVIFCGVNGEVANVMRVTRLDQVFTVHEDEDIALAGFLKGLPVLSSESSISRHRN